MLTLHPAASRRFATAVLTLVCIGLTLSPAFGKPAKKVLIVRGEAPDLPAGNLVVEAIQSTMRLNWSEPIEFYVEVLDFGRFSSPDYERKLADLYAEKYSLVRPDVVVAFTGPATDFATRERARLFPSAPMLFGFIDSRFLAGRAIPERTSLVFFKVDPVGTIKLARAVYPVLRQVVVVGGTAPFDRGWERVVREELKPLERQLSIVYETNSSVEELRQKISVLPRDAIVLFITMTRDATNQPLRPVDILQRLREVAPVPIFGVSTTYLGHGIVGGSLLDPASHGADLGRQALLLLNGEQPHAITTPNTTAVDWRELKRYGISAASVPPSTTIAFREPTAWERSRAPILGMGLVVSLEAALIFALIRQARRRREAQNLLSQRLRFEMTLSDLAISLTATPPDGIDKALEITFGELERSLDLEHLWRWQPGAAEDAGWDSARLREGTPVVFAIEELPPTIRRRFRAAGSEANHQVLSLAIPLAPGDGTYGALFCVRSGRAHANGLWADRDELQMVGGVVINVIQRRRAEKAFAESDRLRGSILDSLPARVAVLDRQGAIISTNDAWMAFGRANGATSDSAIGVGASYLKVCMDGARARHPGAREALTLIQSACAGEHTGHTIEYRCDSPTTERWYLMSAQPLRRAEGGAVITHSDITVRKLNEIALRESEDRFRRLADALPVAVWMSETDAACTYFNKQWLQMTGRKLEQEVGNGWLEGVHPEDRAACLEGYLQAFGARRRFVFNYRIRHADGEYRWLMDVGVPRYGTDGAFHGYVGGCIDITERMEAEQILRSLNRRLVAAQEDERRRIAGELHDHLNQQIALLAMELQRLSLTPPASEASLAAALDDAWRRTTEIASDVHSISHRLHPSKLEALGLVATVRAHCRDVSRDKFRVYFSERNVPAELPPDVSLCLFRILEEALSNAFRHSGAVDAYVTLLASAPDIVLRVADAGCGFEASQHSAGIGLVSMRERLQALSGTLVITTAPGAGTIIEARVPCVAAWEGSVRAAV